jgi:sn-glycerol 3-phosphate transport system ATP-binding protein
MNLMPLDELRLQLGNSQGLAEAGILGVRPEDFVLADGVSEGGVSLDLTVEAIEHVGAETFIYGARDRTDVDSASLTAIAKDIIVRVPGSTAPAIGSPIRAVAPRDKLHLFSADGRQRIAF